MSLLLTTSLLLRRAARGLGVHTDARTINLGRPKACSRPRQVQKLVSADVTAVCPRPATGYRGPRPVSICSREDLQRACQPKFCDCPQRPAPKTAQDIIREMMVFGVKGALAAGLVYWTVAEGFWGEPEDTEDIYVRIRETITSDPYLEEISLPRVEYMKFKIIDTYNRAVLRTIGLLVEVPRRISNQIRDTLYPCESIEDDEKEKK